MADLKKMINRANVLKENDKRNCLKYFIVDDILDDIMYKLSKEAIKDIRANEKKGVAYFKDLKTSTLIELSEIQ